jgi:hypothetical protein
LRRLREIGKKNGIKKKLHQSGNRVIDQLYTRIPTSKIDDLCATAVRLLDLIFSRL